MKILAGSYMQVNDKTLYWRHYDNRFYSVKKSGTDVLYDRHMLVQLAAEPALNRIQSINEKLYSFVTEPNKISDWQPFTFFPPALSANVKNFSVVDAFMTGGRTFLLTEDSAVKLGLPPYICLDLDKLGWGNGMLQFRPEIKGAGTTFGRTKLLKNKLQDILKNNSELQASFNLFSSENNDGIPLLLSSLASYLKRNLGGQSLKFANHAVSASSVLLGKSPIKFLPTWLSTAQSACVMNNMGIISDALPSETLLYDGLSANEIRFTPSTVRALYFDNANSDQELKTIVSRVSDDYAELEETLFNMMQDVRKYLELIATTTKPTKDGKISWIKIGDIHEEFVKNKNGEYINAIKYRKQKYSWVLAKDEVIVRCVGKFYTDMESYYGKDIGYISENIDELRFHHELYILNVLRDHIRVCTKFNVASELVQHINLTQNDRKAICRKVVNMIKNSVNESIYLNLDIDDANVYVSIVYEAINQKSLYTIPRLEIVEPFA